MIQTGVRFRPDPPVPIKGEMERMIRGAAIKDIVGRTKKEDRNRHNILAIYRQKMIANWQYLSKQQIVVQNGNFQRLC